MEQLHRFGKSWPEWSENEHLRLVHFEYYLHNLANMECFPRKMGRKRAFRQPGGNANLHTLSQEGLLGKACDAWRNITARRDDASYHLLVAHPHQLSHLTSHFVSPTWSAHTIFILELLWRVIQSIMEYNGGSVVAMVGKDCVAIASDLRLGNQALGISSNFQKVFRSPFSSFLFELAWNFPDISYYRSHLSWSTGPRNRCNNTVSGTAI